MTVKSWIDKMNIHKLVYLTLKDACDISWTTLHDIGHVRAEFLLRTELTTDDTHSKTTHCKHIHNSYIRNSARVGRNRVWPSKRAYSSKHKLDDETGAFGVTFSLATKYPPST